MNNINSIESDRELLELAAKAGGYQLSAVSDMIWSDAAVEYIPWNPLTDDGDCARMEAALRITVRWCFDGRVFAECEDGGTGNELFANHDGDRNAARRRASVCAAVDRLIEGLEG